MVKSKPLEVNTNFQRKEPHFEGLVKRMTKFQGLLSQPHPHWRPIKVNNSLALTGRHFEWRIRRYP